MLRSKLIPLLSTVSVLTTQSSVWAMGAHLPQPKTLAGTLNPCVAPGTAPTPSLDPKVNLDVDANAIRNLLFTRNNDVFVSANQVQRAKDNVALARTLLLPSINVSALVLAAGNPTFALTQVQFLLPFLIPQNWFALKRSKNLFEADRLAYRITEANTYASAYSIYYTILNDLGVMETLASSVHDWREIEQFTAEQFRYGLATQESLSLATSQRALAELRYEKIRTLQADHIADFKKALALAPDQQITLVREHVPAAPSESLAYEKAFQLATDRSLELQQVKSLLMASREAKWSNYFGFINSATATANNYNYPGSPYNNTNGGAPSRGPSLAFDNYMGALNFRFGLDYFPTLRLSQRNIDDVVLRTREIALEVNRVLEANTRKMPSISERVRLAREAEKSLRTNYEIVIDRYRTGAGATLLDIIQARLGIEQSVVERLGAETELDVSRVALHRLFMSGAFDKVPVCAATFKKFDDKAGPKEAAANAEADGATNGTLSTPIIAP